jgi:hypothetical protein
MGLGSWFRSLKIFFNYAKNLNLKHDEDVILSIKYHVEGEDERETIKTGKFICVKLL